MTTFFFYKHFINAEFVNKISNSYQMNDGYIIVKEYNTEKDDLVISDVSMENKKILYGKIVHFYSMNINSVLSKINDIEECRFKNKITNYTVSTIYSNKMTGGVYKSYIIY